MFSIISLITILSVSLDGFCLGYALGIAKCKIRISIFILIGIIAYILSSVAMFIGDLLFGTISEAQCSLLCAFIFFTLSFISAFSPENRVMSNNFTAAFIGGFGVAIDASTAAFALAVEGYSLFLCPILLGIFHFILSYSGYKLSHSVLSQKLKSKIPYISSIILFALGITRLL
ncbi:MAG: hypothetical protein E7432_08205 [Ruminococcaceae bacterium]|nr:hypothetical protein [Oscillospiraceae bacterium]